MSHETTPPSLTPPSDAPARQALAAQQANQDSARAHNAQAVARLGAWADGAQRAEHIRALVAITLEHLGPQAAEDTRASAAQWQAWALGLAEASEAPSP